MLKPLCVLLLAASAAPAQRPAQRPAHPAASSPEARASAAFLAARSAGPLALHAFLQRMPKGADLHMHLSGAVYAETFLSNAAQDGLCVDPAKLVFLKPAAAQAAPAQPAPAQPAPAQPSAAQANCPGPAVPVATVFANTPQSQHLYDALIDAFSMRSFVPSAGVSGHDQFFATFARFGVLGSRHLGEWLDEVTTRAAAQNEQYLEVMQTPSFGKTPLPPWPTSPAPATTAGSSTPDADSGTSPAELTALRDKLLASGLRDEIATDRAEFAEALAARNRLQHCQAPAPRPACAVQVRFLYQVLRAFPPQQVFAQTLLAFEVAAADPNVVGLNFVQPEDAYMAMSEYHRQMLMLDFLHSLYPAVHISLHAGELAPGLVPPAGLSFHIREAVDLGHAERIGHGVDVMHEAEPLKLLQELAARHVMVEINLTSNDVILGVVPPSHPLPGYRAAHVPVALSTDDEGVSRIDLTHEYTRAALDFHLTYPDLKQMARTSIEHTFLPGPGLWQQRDDFTRITPACAGQPLGADTPRPPCLAFLQSSPHAAQQWELEHRFRVFESTLP